MKCPICGKEITDETLICDGCGDTTACRIQNDKLNALRVNTVPETLRPFRSKFAAVYAGLTSLICIFSVILLIAALTGTLAPLKVVTAALFAVLSGSSAYGCWRCFFAGTGPMPSFKRIRSLPYFVKYILMVAQILLLIAVFLCMAFMIIVSVAVNKGGSALVEEVKTLDLGILTGLTRVITGALSIGLDIACIIMAVICAVCVVLVGGLAGSFNKIGRQYKILTDFSLGKSEKPLKEVKYTSVYVWGLIITACGVLCIRKSFDNVCFGLLCASLGIYVILSAVMLRLVGKRSVEVNNALMREQIILDSLTERTERVAAYRAYKNDHPDDRADDDEPADDGDDEPANDSAVPVLAEPAPVDPAPADDSSADTVPADETPAWVLPPIKD